MMNSNVSVAELAELYNVPLTEAEDAVRSLHSGKQDDEPAQVSQEKKRRGRRPGVRNKKKSHFKIVAQVEDAPVDQNAVLREAVYSLLQYTATKYPELGFALGRAAGMILEKT